MSSSYGLFQILDEIDEQYFFKTRPIEIFQFNSKSKELINALFKCILASSSVYHDDEEKKLILEDINNKYKKYFHNEQDFDSNQKEEELTDLKIYLNTISECKWLEELKLFFPCNEYEEFIDETILTKGLKNIAIDFISRTNNIHERANSKILQKLCFANERLCVERNDEKINKNKINKELHPQYELETPPHPAPVFIKSETVDVDNINNENSVKVLFDLSTACYQYIRNEFLTNDKVINTEIYPKYDKKLNDLWYFDFDNDNEVTRDDLIKGFINYGHHFISIDKSCHNMVNSYIQKKIIDAIRLIYYEEKIKNPSNDLITENNPSSLCLSICDDPTIIAELEKAVLNLLDKENEHYNLPEPIHMDDKYTIYLGNKELLFHQENYGQSFKPFLSHIDSDIVESCQSTLESLRCSFIHLGIALNIHPFKLQLLMRSKAIEIINDINNELKLFFEDPLNDLLTPSSLVDLAILQLIWLNEDFKGARIMVLSFECNNDGMSRFKSNAVYEPLEHSGLDIILKLQDVHFTLLIPDREDTENYFIWGEKPIDDIIQEIESFNINYPDEIVNCNIFACPFSPN